MSFLYDRTGKQNTAINYLLKRRPVKSFAWMSYIGNQLYKGSASFKSLKIKQRRHQFFPSATTYSMQNRRKNWAKVHPFFYKLSFMFLLLLLPRDRVTLKIFSKDNKDTILVLSSLKYKTMFVYVWGESALFDFSKENKVHINWSKSISTHIFWMIVKGMVLRKYIQKPLPQAFLLTTFLGARCSDLLPFRWVFSPKSLSFAKKILSFFLTDLAEIVKYWEK